MTQTFNEMLKELKDRKRQRNIIDNDFTEDEELFTKSKISGYLLARENELEFLTKMRSRYMNSYCYDDFIISFDKIISEIKLELETAKKEGIES
jgi:hypothetical protein